MRNLRGVGILRRGLWSDMSMVTSASEKRGDRGSAFGVRVWSVSQHEVRKRKRREGAGCSELCG